MAFDLAWNWRNTLGFVSDPAYAVQGDSSVIATYTNANGFSVQAGWSTIDGLSNIINTNDPRIAGYAYQSNNGGPAIYTVNLASGSAPGAGAYLVDLAFGGNDEGRPISFKLFDDTTLKIDGSGGGAGIATSAGQYVDAALALITATTTWTGAQVPVTFATTSVKLHLSLNSIGGYTVLAHFRLTLATGGSLKAAVWARNRNTVLGAGRVA